MYRQSENNLFKQQYLLHMFSQYGELRLTSGWDRFVSLGHPSKFRQVSRLGSVTARHSSSGRQWSFAALNRGRLLYSARRQSRWALAHILVTFVLCCMTQWLCFCSGTDSVLLAFLSLWQNRELNTVRSIIGRRAMILVVQLCCRSSVRHRANISFVYCDVELLVFADERDGDNLRTRSAAFAARACHYWRYFVTQLYAMQCNTNLRSAVRRTKWTTLCICTVRGVVFKRG